MTGTMIRPSPWPSGHAQKFAFAWPGVGLPQGRKSDFLAAGSIPAGENSRTSRKVFEQLIYGANMRSIDSSQRKVL